MEYYSCLHIWQICSLPNDVHIRVNVDEVHLLAFTLFFSFRPRAVRGSPTPPRSAGASAQVCRAAGVPGGRCAGASAQCAEASAQVCGGGRCAGASARCAAALTSLAECWRRTDASSRGRDRTREEACPAEDAFPRGSGQKKNPSHVYASC